MEHLNIQEVIKEKEEKKERRKKRKKETQKRKQPKHFFPGVNEWAVSGANTRGLPSKLSSLLNLDSKTA